MLRIFRPNLISKEDFSERCGTEPMATILMTRRRRWIVHVTRRETSIAKTALHWIPEGKCKRHNPKNTWRRTVEKSEFCFRFLFLFFSLITIFIFFFLYVFCFCEITLSLHCIFSLYTVLVLFSSFSLPFLSFLLQVLVLSTFTRSYHNFYLFSFLFFLFLSSYLFGPLCLFVFFFLLSYCCNFFVYPLLVRS